MITTSQTLPTAIDDLLTQIRDLYREQFDRSWMVAALKDSALDDRTLQDIRHALTLTSPTIWDLPVLHRGVSALNSYVRLIRASVLPRARELIGLSTFSIGGYKQNSDSRLHQRLVLYTLPLNVDRLSDLISELETSLPAIPMKQPLYRRRESLRIAL